MAPWNVTPLANYNVSQQNPTATWPPLQDATDKPTAISDDFFTLDQYFTGLKVNVAVRSLVCVGGMLGNFLNIRAFYRMGLDDSVTIAFFNLAILDFFILITTFVSTVSTLCQILERDLDVYFHFNPYFITLLSINFGRSFTYACTYVTAFLAIQRCLCVVIPFHFKGVVTRVRTNIIMLLIWGYCMICGAVLVSQTEIRKQTLTVANSTLSVFVMIMKPPRRYVISYLQIANNITLNISCVFLVLVCVLVMARALLKSVQFRQTSANVGSQGAEKNPHDISEAAGTLSKGTAGSSKERLVIVQVSLVSAIFLITSTPNLVISVASSIVPQFRHYRRYHYTFASCIDIRLTVESVNSAVNFFVYYKYNSKFRQLCFKRQQ